jgi:hypothetical protein
LKKWRVYPLHPATLEIEMNSGAGLSPRLLYLCVLFAETLAIATTAPALLNPEPIYKEKRSGAALLADAFFICP